MSGERWSRRRFVGWGLAALAAALVVPLIQALRSLRGRLLRSWHEPAPPMDIPADTFLLLAAADLAGALHGRRLVPDHQAVLAERLARLGQRDGGWIEEFASLVALADRWSVAEEGTAFIHATPGTREAVLERLMGPSTRDLRSELLALVSAGERVRRKARQSTIPRLHLVYTRSPVPWWLRGHPRGPGQPGQQLAYTRRREPLAC